MDEVGVDQSERIERFARTVFLALDGKAASASFVRTVARTVWAPLWPEIRHRVLSERPDAGEELERLSRPADDVEAAIAAAKDPDYWPDPEPLGDPPPKSIPLDGVPDVLRRHVESVAGFAQVPTDAALMLALAAVSTCVHGRAQVAVRSGWVEYLCIYVALVMESGTRKSAVYESMFGCVERWEARQAQSCAPDTARGLAEREILESQFSAAKKAAARGRATMHEVEAARIALEDHQVPRARRLIASDITPEALASRMLEHHGCLAIAAPEGDPLRIATGRYGNGPNLDIMKRAWSCERVIVDRIGRPSETIRRPSLVLALAFQPSVLETMEHSRTLRGEGLYGRMLWAMPEDNVGHRLTGDDVPALDDQAVADYERLIQGLLELEAAGVEKDGALVPRTMTLSAGAEEYVTRVWLPAIEGRLAEDGDLRDLRDWGGKMAGQAIRIAALLEIVRRVDQGLDAWFGHISEQSVHTAVNIMQALAQHARAALSGGRRDELGEYVLRRLAALPDEDRTVRGAWQAAKRRRDIENVGDLQEVLDRLERHHWIRIHAVASNGRGRRPSPRIEVHPDAYFGDGRRNSGGISVTPQFIHGPHNSNSGGNGVHVGS